MTALHEGGDLVVQEVLTSDLSARLGALERVLEVGGDRLEPRAAARAAEVVRRGRERSSLAAVGSVPATVIALAGATGSGKSSLFNAFAGQDVAVVGARRPTTSSPSAVVWGEVPDALLDWLEVPTRHRAAEVVGSGGRPVDLDGLVMLDLPDHDSTDTGNALQVDRMVDLVDLVVWVVDPQKYADGALHERYLRHLTGHQELLLVVLNQVDTLAPEAADACEDDLRNLLAADGLDRVHVMRTSARTGEGVEVLRRVVADAVASTSASVRRTEADVLAAGRALAPSVGPGERDAASLAGTDALVTALAGAAGVPTVLDAVRAGELRNGSLLTGWPATTWLRRLRRDPLARLRVLAGSREPGRREPGEDATVRARLVRSSLSGASATERAQVSRAARSVAQTAARGMPRGWADAVRASVAPAVDDVGGMMADRLDQALVTVGLRSRAPWWQRAARGAQLALLLVALAGLVWTAALAAGAWLRLPLPGTPRVGAPPLDVPLPWVLLVAGVLAGVLLSLVLRPAVVARARRRTAVVRSRLHAAVSEVAAATLLVPLGRVLADHRSARLALGDLLGDDEPRELPAVRPAPAVGAAVTEGSKAERAGLRRLRRPRGSSRA